MVTLPCPQQSNGFIDEEEVFKLVIGTLKLPLSYLDELVPYEIGWLIENHDEKEKEHYELISYAFRVGYVSAKEGKYIPLFDKESSRQPITLEEKAKGFAELENIFGR